MEGGEADRVGGGEEGRDLEAGICGAAPAEAGVSPTGLHHVGAGFISTEHGDCGWFMA